MPTKLFETALYLAMSETHIQKKDVALLVRKTDGNIKSIGVNNSISPYETHSAIVNLIQNNRVESDDFIVLSTPTSPPWIRDEGMMKMLPDFKYFTNPIVYFSWPRNQIVYRFWDDFKKVWADKKSNSFEFRTFFKEIPDFPLDPVKLAFPFAGKKFDFSLFLKNLKDCNDWFELNKGKNEILPIKSFKAAKRHTTYNKGPAMDLPIDLKVPQGDKNEALINKIFSVLAWAVVQSGLYKRKKNKKYNGHNIASVLRGPNNQLLGWGLNTNFKSSFTLHGEVNLLQSLQTQNDKALAIPDGTILYSTLEPCYMCAGMYVNGVDRNRQVLPDPTLSCYYGQKDQAITKNYLELRVTNTKQAIAPNPSSVGANINEALEKAKLKSSKGFIPMTVFLEQEDALEQINTASQIFLNLLPKEGTQERTIWENGLKLLYHIDNGIARFWEKQKGKYYEDVIPKSK